MADNNSKRNVTGSYPGVTGSYKKGSAYPKPTGDVNRRSETVKNGGTPPDDSKNNKDSGFDFKLWFSSENMRGFLRQLRFYGICVAVALLLTAGIVTMANDIFAFIKEDEMKTVTIAENSSTKAIAKALGDAEIIEHPWLFTLYSKLKKADGKYQFGDYSINSKLGYDQIISKLKKPSVQAETFTVTVGVGWTQDEFVEYMTSKKYANATELETALNNYDFEDFPFVEKLPKRRSRLEGYLPAGDYEFYKGESAVSIVSKLLTRFSETVLTEENNTLITASGRSLDEIITVASLIQCECDSADMYKGAAAVIFNRLASETDNFLKLTSTINYVLPTPKEVLSADDKKTDSEYNTYMYSGLPTGPVCTPSAEAISAVLAPESSAYLYFISDGDKSLFASSKEEHIKNLDKVSKSAKGTDTIR